MRNNGGGGGDTEKVVESDELVHAIDFGLVSFDPQSVVASTGFVPLYIFQ